MHSLVAYFLGGVAYRTSCADVCARGNDSSNDQYS